jgi:hypothetical protein
MRFSRGPAPNRVPSAVKLLLALVAALPLALAPPMARAIEEPKYVVVQALGDVEVREVAPLLVAEVVVPGPADEAGNQGFRVLAGYIFGKNQGERKIEMTAPVTLAPAPQRIAMTAPVTQGAVEGGFVVRFMMPSTFTRETLPVPLDARIAFRELPATRYVVIRYSGFWSERNYDEHLALLRERARAAGLVTSGEPVYARYDPPWTPWFLRRNEIWLTLA